MTDWFSKFLSHRNYRRFIILTRSRTGSNLLSSLLGSHRNIHMHGEVFQRLNGRTHLQILTQVFCSQPRDVRAAGFKIFYYHPFDDASGAIWNHLLQMPGLAIIHLKRRNILRTLISRRIAQETNVWQIKEGSATNAAKEPISYTAAELQSEFEATRTWEHDFDERFRQHAKLEIYYEELTRQPQSELDRIITFLGLPCQELRTPLLRQNPESAAALLKNYHELKQAFAGTPWYEFFDEQLP